MFINWVYHTIGTMNQKQIDLKYLPKKLRAVKIGNWRDQTDFTRIAINGKILYQVKHFDLESTSTIDLDQYFKMVVGYKNSGYEVILLER